MKQKTPTIFVMMPAYRDPVLLDTLREIFQKADNPDCVFVAIGAQYDEDIPMPDLSEFNPKNLRVLSIHPDGRPGVYRLRHLLNKLYANEDYYLSIDSHTELEQSWDTKLIAILEAQPEYKCILTSSERPPSKEAYTDLRMSVSYEKLGDHPEECTRIVMRDFDEKPLYTENGYQKYPEVSYLQAGLFFTRGQFAREIRWGQFWQNEQEEPFLSYETFMLGWTKRLLTSEQIIKHVPEKYYEAVYKEIPETPHRKFNDMWKSQSDYLPYVTPRVWNVYMYNTGPFKIEKAVKTPAEWWASIGLWGEYCKHLHHSGEIF
jgi:hypothetical protein